MPRRPRSASFDQRGQREIEVVAAEQQVLADRHALELRVAAGRSRARIRLKSVVPPPTSQHQHQRAVAAAALGELAPVRGDPRVERRDRLLEQRQLLEPGAAAPPARSARAPLRRTTRARSGRSAACSSAAAVAGRDASRFHASRRCARSARDASTGDSARTFVYRPTAAAARVRSTDGLASHDLADGDLPRRHQRALVAREARRRRRRGRRSTGRRAGRACDLARRREVEERRQRRRRADLAGARRAAGPSNDRGSRRGVARSTRSARVGRAEIDADEAARRRGSVVRRAHGCSARASSAAAPSRADAPQLDASRLRSRGSRACTGTSRALAAVDLQRHLERRSAPRSRRPSPRSARRPVVLAHRGAEEAELGRLADDQSRTRAGRSPRSCLPPCRTARRTSALSGAGIPGTAGIALSMPT